MPTELCPYLPPEELCVHPRARGGNATPPPLHAVQGVLSYATAWPSKASRYKAGIPGAKAFNYRSYRAGVSLRTRLHARCSGCGLRAIALVFRSFWFSFLGRLTVKKRGSEYRQGAWRTGCVRAGTGGCWKRLGRHSFVGWCFPGSESG